jgi:hypothetical protein
VMGSSPDAIQRCMDIVYAYSGTRGRQRPQMLTDVPGCLVGVIKGKQSVFRDSMGGKSQHIRQATESTCSCP